MKKSPDEKKLLERLSAGVLSRDGFLGSDPRPVGDIIDTDTSTVHRLETTHEEIAAKLKRIYDKVASNIGRPVKLSESLTGVYREAMGKIPCPWGQCRVFAKGEVEITNAETGRVMHITPLAIHMIEKHGFYQGHGSPFRLDPDAIQACDA